MRDVTGLVLLCGGCETFPGDMLGVKVISEVEKLIVVEDTVMTTEVCVWTGEVMASGTGVIPEVDVKLTVDSEMAAMVPLLFSEMGLRVVLSRVLSILVSWLDTFTGTTEDILKIDDSVVTLLKLFMFVNPEGSKLSRQSAVQPHGIPRSARAPLRPSILPARLGREAEPKTLLAQPGPDAPAPPPGSGVGDSCFSPPLPL